MKYPVALAALLLATSATAAIVGTMKPAEPLTAERVASLPAAQGAAWSDYLDRSRKTMAADKSVLATERQGLASAPPGPPGGSPASAPLDRPEDWYASAEARRIADTILSYQTPAGGWGKNQDWSGPPRQRGQSFVPIENLPANARDDIQASASWRYVGTIDNGATTSELRYLAKVQRALPGSEGDLYRAAITKGLRYLFAAEFPGGGWPQVWPLQGGYHDAITYNDAAVTEVAEFLLDVAGKDPEFAFLPADQKRAAADAARRTTRLILATQQQQAGELAIWGQQHDALTRKPVGARNFEPAALSTAESVALLRYLMRQPDRTPEVERAVAGAVAWLKKHAVHDVEWARTDEGRSLHRKPGAGPIWARFHDLESGKPIFGDRDRQIRDDVNEVSAERRSGYSWFSNSPGRLIETAEKWLQKKS